MAVKTWIYGKPDIQYEGCVIDTYEHNDPWDSDWYAVCWDRERQEPVRVQYNTTRCGSGGDAEIDATEDVLRELYNYYRRVERKWFDETRNEEQAKEIRKGDMVKVVRGRKIPKGTVGKVFWIGETYNRFSREYENRVGIEVGGDRKFLPAEYVENTEWEQRLLHGKDRKQEIRRLVMNRIPIHYRHVFS